MNYFRAVLKSGEKSERVLELLNSVIEVNAANYTAWHYRRQTLDALAADLHAELELITEIGLENPKNYQIWYDSLPNTTNCLCLFTQFVVVGLASYECVCPS